MTFPATRHASCLCAAVEIRISGPMGPPLACHCRQCRKISGHFTAASGTSKSGVAVSGPLRWFRSSEGAQRGFCSHCGSYLLWQSDTADEVYVSLGALNGPTGLTLAGHIYCADKGDYYQIADGLPQWPQGDI